MIDKIIRKFMEKKLNKDTNLVGRQNSINELKEMADKLTKKDEELKENYKLIEIENNILKMVAKKENFESILHNIVDSIENFYVEDSIIVNILKYDIVTNKLYDLVLSDSNVSFEYKKLVGSGININLNKLLCQENNCKIRTIEINNDNNNETDLEFIEDFSKIKNLAEKNDIHAIQLLPLVGSNNKFHGLIIIYFKDDSYLQKVYKKLLCWAAKIMLIILEKKDSNELLNTNIEEIKQKNKLLESIIDASGGYLWMKDEDYKYKFCDYLYHLNIFGKINKNEILGKTDFELSNEYTTDTGLQNQFKEVSFITDNFTIELKTQARFITGFYIGNELVILETIKTPLIDVFGEHKGIVGFSWDRSDESYLVFKDIDLLKEENRIKILTSNEYPYIPFVYYIIPNRKYCKKVISRPIYDDSTIVDKRNLVFSDEGIL
jgi:DNA-binding ferritin-like protein (Dps family)